MDEIQHTLVRCPLRGQSNGNVGAKSERAYRTCPGRCKSLYPAPVRSLPGTRHRARVLSPEEVSSSDHYQTPIFLAVTGLWGSGKVSLLASKIFSTVVVTSHSSRVLPHLFSSANISPVRFDLHLQDWWCVGKRETSFPVNKLTDLLAAIFVAFN